MICLLNLSVLTLALLWQVECREKRQADDGFRNEIPGEANIDYPILASVPDTSFTCAGRVMGGYYADVETQCQVFHICGGSSSIFGSIKYSFVCPNGTLFHQQYFTCDWWYNVDCSLAEDSFDLNNNIGVEDANVDSGNKGSNNFQSGLSAQDPLPTYGKPTSLKTRPGNKSGRKMKKPRNNGNGKGKKSPVRVQITSNDVEVFRFPNFGASSQRQKRKNNMEILTEQEKFLFVDDRQPRDYEEYAEEYLPNPIFD